MSAGEGSAAGHVVEDRSEARRPHAEDEASTRAGRRLLIVGSGARFAARLQHGCDQAGWSVTTLIPEDPMALPPTAWMPVEAREEQRDLIAEVEAADVVVMLGSIGPVTTVADDARTLDTVLGHARPGSTLLALTSLSVFGDAGSRPLTEADTPHPPDELAPAFAAESRVLTAGDWLRAVVVRVGLVYALDGGALIDQGVELARASGVSRYFGRQEDIIPTVHEDDLLSLVLDLLETPGASGTYHAVSGSTSVQGLARLIAARAGVADIAAWDAESMTAAFGTSAEVPRTNLITDPAGSRAVTELGWTPGKMSLTTALAPT